jgi:uncharacterized protein (TIGR03437 family)
VNGPAQSVDTANIGDGALSLQVSASVSWLVPTVGQTHSCSLRGNCVPVNIALQTASLAKGIYTGLVTIGAPGALDAPQNVSVTVQIGGGVPDSVQLYVAPGGSSSLTFKTNNPLTTSVSSPAGVSLALGLQGNGSFQFTYPYVLTAGAAGGTAAGAYSGTFTVSGSGFAPDNKTVPVTVNVTSNPIAAGSSSSLLFRAAVGAAAQTQYVAVSNSGSGTLTVSGATATVSSGSGWLSATVSGNLVSVIADPTGLAQGSYHGQVSIAGNAANSLTVPVELDVLAAGPPVAAFQGVVDNATFQAGQAVAPGDIVALFGEQLTMGVPMAASGLPLGTQLGGAQVMVNGTAAPVYYVSYNQINFQIPFEATTGNASVQVIRDGQAGNTISLSIAPSAPRLLQFLGTYGIIVNQDGSFPIPVTPGLNSHPAQELDVLTIYAIGMGPTTPAVASGAGSPAAPPFAVLGSTPQVYFAPGLFSDGIVVGPQFAGLTPSFVGLYQINVQIPVGIPKGSAIPLFVTTPDGVSNTVNIAVQ